MPKKMLPKETPGPRLEPDARRAHLLAVGAAAFGAQAYEDVQVDQVARLAGVSRGLLYHYFPSKRDFFSAVIQRGYDEILAVTRPDPALSPEAQLRAGLQAYLDYVEGHPHTYRAIFRSAASSDAGLRETVNRNLDAQARRVLVGLGEGASSHTLAYLAVRSWLAFLIQAVLDWMDHDHGQRIDRERLIEVCSGALRGAVKAAGQPVQEGLTPGPST